MSGQPQVNSALRALLRAQRVTFQGDARARAAARQLNRSLLEPALSTSASQEEKDQAILGAKQVAQYLRENVLQGVPKEDRYALRFTPSIALGDNESIKKVTPAPSLSEITSTMNAGVKRRRRKSSQSQASPSEGQSGEGDATSASATS